MADPAYRASLVKAVVAAYRSHEDPVFAQILADADATDLETIAHASRLEWLPAHIFDGLNRITWDAIGDEGYEAFWNRQTKAALDMPLFGAIVKGALSMFGVRPSALLRFVGRGWERTTRNYGRVEHVIDSNSIRLSLIDLPEEGRMRTVALSMKASLIALIETTGTTGQAEMDLSAKDEGRFEFTASWE